MRRVLTGYAVSYNLRHAGTDMSFRTLQIDVCDGESYFTELAPYIH